MLGFSLEWIIERKIRELKTPVWNLFGYLFMQSRKLEISGTIRYQSSRYIRSYSIIIIVHLPDFALILDVMMIE